MRIAVFGATGFIGSYIVESLVSRGIIPRILVRPGSENKIVMPDSCEIVIGDITDESAVRKTCRECASAVYAVGIIRQFPQKGITYQSLHVDCVRRFVSSAEDAGIGRIGLISANGAESSGTSYQRSKAAGESLVQNGSIPWTILRPSLVYGDPRGRSEFLSMVRDSIVSMPLPAPSFFGGKGPDAFRFSPVHAADLSALTVALMLDVRAAGDVIAVGGQEVVSFKTIIERVAGVCGRRKLFVPVPVGAAIMAARMLQRFAAFPVTSEQLTMLAGGNVCNSEAVFSRYDIVPRRMNDDTLSYLAQ